MHDKTTINNNNNNNKTDKANGYEGQTGGPKMVVTSKELGLAWPEGPNHEKGGATADRTDLPLIKRSKSRHEIKDATFLRPLRDATSTVMHLTNTVPIC